MNFYLICLDIERDFLPNMLFSRDLRKSLDNKACIRVVLMDLFKAFDTMNHELLSVKLHAFRFCKDDLKLIISYGVDHWQTMKLSFSTTS